MDALIAGYHRFRATGWPERRRLFEELAERGQSPRALVIACSDSRVDPSMIFDAAPGELFTIRNIGNVVPPYQPDGAYHGTSAAIEFAVRALEVRDIIVMGHGMCGLVQAVLRGVPAGLTDFVAPWARLAEPARRVLACNPADPQLACEYENIRLSLANLRSFPWIAERLEAGRLRLHGTHFDVRHGVLNLLQPDGSFAPA
ncbi:MAG TPA: carbonic anhydrase [Acetobacteraceae bacterium]|nr:carbonic anhydrase [Acetobacteraceae bacterium]